jgi:hypothetical protein
VAGTCEYGNELLGSINAGNLTSCKTSELLKKDSARWSKSVTLIYTMIQSSYRLVKIT